MVGASGESPPVGIVPAAGYGTRLGMSGSKELTPVGGRPVIDHLLRRMRAAGASQLRVVIRPEKEDLLAHLSALPDTTIVTGHPDSLGSSLALAAEGVEAERTVIAGFPDSVWEPPDGFDSLLARLARAPVVEAVLGLFADADADPAHVVDLDPRSGLIRGIEVRPRPRAPYAIWAAAAAPARTFRRLAAGGHPSALFAELARREGVAGVALSASYIDAGTPRGLRLARARYRSRPGPD